MPAANIDTILDELKLALMQSDTIATVFEILFDHDAILVTSGEKCSLPEGLVEVLETVAPQSSGKDHGATAKKSIANGLFVRHGGKQCIHGGCLMDGKMAAVVYFEDILMGAVALMRSPSDILYSRFSITPTKKGSNPPPYGNPVPHSRTRH